MSHHSNKDPQDSVVQVADLVKSFGPRTVLDRVSLKAMPGETLVIMGASGCGKSTLLRNIVGAYTPDSGSIKLFGQEITTMKEREMNEVRKRFGILFQQGALYNSMTVGDNVALPLREHTDLDENIIDIMVKMKLELVGLRDFDYLMPAALSGGMKKRVGLARAIALDPEILFYDEPTAGLDPIVAGVIDQLIMDLSRRLGVTSMVVTHDMVSAFKIADKIVMLYDGKVMQTGTPEEIRNSKNRFVRQFISGAADGPISLRKSMTDYSEDLVGD
ncbi:MAG: ABC transporter ATP-binding protein [Planctomycetes bacterium]|nr:ABC transporter ATP-binding protein [Planctomycetota bacterium]